MTETERFKTEAELCARFLSEIPKGWTPYCETAGWDILLVRDADGFQIGIQAKLRFTAQALAQCLDDDYSHADQPGPDCRAVLVPVDGVQDHLSRIAAYVGVTMITCRPSRDKFGGRYFRPFSPDLPKIDADLAWHSARDWHELAPARRCELPEYVPDVVAGAAAPVQLTAWKIKAIKIAVTLEIRGFVTRKDFSHHKLDHRRWLAAEPKWLVLEKGAFIAGPGLPRFKAQHPRVYEEIKADAAKWLPASTDGATPSLF